MNNISFHDLAIRELNDARDYYDEIYFGLGENFINEIEKTLKRMIELPLSFPIIKSKIRKAVIRKFQYSILFRIDMDEIFVLTIMHQKRKPDYWIGRI